MTRRAFTLIEVLLVILVLGLLAAISLPELGKEMERRSLVESADRLRALVVMTHARAMQDGRRYRIQFPGTIDPLDTRTDKDIDVPIKTEQPEIHRQIDPLGNPDAFERFDAPWIPQNVMQEGTRCVAVQPGRPNFEITAESPIAGPQISEGHATFVPVTLNPDGTSDWATFVLTDLPYDTELSAESAPQIINLIVDGRTGQAWMQRALRVQEVELMQERGAEPILHVDFTSGEWITENNILEVHMQRGGGVSGGRSSGR